MNPDRLKVAIGVVYGGPPKKVWVAAGSRGVVRVQLAGNRERFVQELTRRKVIIVDTRNWVVTALRQIQEYLNGRRHKFCLEVCCFNKDVFSTKVIKVLRTIPWGTTITYGELARRAGHPQAARAVGRVMSANPLPILVPCHRVVAASGLGGFGGGVKMKQALLTFEGVSLDSWVRVGR